MAWILNGHEKLSLSPPNHAHSPSTPCLLVCISSFHLLLNFHLNHFTKWFVSLTWKGLCSQSFCFLLKNTAGLIHETHWLQSVKSAGARVNYLEITTEEQAVQPNISVTDFILHSSIIQRGSIELCGGMRAGNGNTASLLLDSNTSHWTLVSVLWNYNRQTVNGALAAVHINTACQQALWSMFHLFIPLHLSYPRTCPNDI